MLLRLTSVKFGARQGARTALFTQTRFNATAASAPTATATSTSTAAILPPLPGQNAFSNITPNIRDKLGRDLHKQPNHPLSILYTMIQHHFSKNYIQSTSSSTTQQQQPLFTFFDSLSPIVSTQRNFDDLLVPQDHVSRRKTDTYYVNESTVLRTHMTAHQTELMEQGHKAYLMAGDVYRRDEIDASHYPVFHQLDGVRVWTQEELKALGYTTPETQSQFITQDLKATIQGVVQLLFGQHTPMRWVDAYFPFTHPSYELEVQYQGQWLEVLGCGQIQSRILSQRSLSHTSGWAFGMGLERLAMVLFQIPDIRLFWSQDARFLQQFKQGQIGTFQPYSKYPPCYKDISFWLPPSTSSTSTSSTALTNEEITALADRNFHENDFCSEVRNIAGDLVERVQKIDEFIHPKTKRMSRCYRILYRSMDRNLTNEEIDMLQAQIRNKVATIPGIELR